MKILLIGVGLLSLMSCAHNPSTAEMSVAPTVERSLASKSKYMSAQYMRMADLTKVRIMNSEGYDQVGRAVRATNVPKEMVQRLMDESGDDALLSKIFVSKGETSIYVFITQMSRDGKAIYRINLVKQFSNGSLSLIDFNITNALTNEMTAVNGPDDSLETYKIIADRNFFPF